MESFSWLKFAAVIFGGDKQQPEICLRSQATFTLTVLFVLCKLNKFIL